ncbi:unnamed protein product [Gongylonema pulchrum]|uniref:Cation/H+ exchanger transmembrane domain-containing protein n=1 Tax=Gongylonema pulchrum TaxID=637853 RepID=A0A3P7NVQ7_9BILA|nr:unnamed protein product [Gongylonema pulchrum]
MFATLISAVDPVAVLSVFEEINVNRLLYICVFGESLLNDAVTIVLYHALVVMAKIGPENLETQDFITVPLSFVLVSFGGILIGIVGAAVAGLVTKYLRAEIFALFKFSFISANFTSFLSMAFSFANFQTSSSVARAIFYIHNNIIYIGQTLFLKIFSVTRHVSKEPWISLSLLSRSE